MIHRTFRSLDDAPKLVGFTIKQWAMLILGAGSVLGVIHLAHVPTKPAISLCVFLIGLPAALTYVSESGSLQLSVLLRAMWRWRWSAHILPVTSLGDSRARGLVIFGEDEEALDERPGQGSPFDAEDAAIEPEGLLIAEDGIYVRYLEVGTVNPLAVACSHAVTPILPIRCATPAWRSRGQRLSARTVGRSVGLTSARLTGRSAGAAIAGRARTRAHARAAERSARSQKDCARAASSDAISGVCVNVANRRSSPRSSPISMW